MKKLLSVFTAVAFLMVMTIAVNAQEPEKKQADKKAKTEKCESKKSECCKKAEAAKCDKTKKEEKKK
jgi:Ni/Co efflux regulator RcnB